MLGILAIVALVGMIICQIIVLVKMFQTAGIVQGIIGLICGIWAFIWGWMNAGKLGIKNIMLIWTVDPGLSRSHHRRRRFQLQL